MSQELMELSTASLTIEDTSVGDLLTDFAGGGTGRSSPGSPHSQDSCHMNTDEDEQLDAQGPLQIKVRKSHSLRRTDSLHASKMPAYKMDANPRGQALIVEIEEYQNDVQERRHGSNVDVKNLETLLKQLYFTVHLRRNLTKRELDKSLDDFSRLPEHREADMMILAILSHGRDGHVCTADGQAVSTEKIYEKFNNHYCPTLTGKPKFFIIQACRGDDTDFGMSDESESLSLHQPRKRKATGTTVKDTIPWNGFGEVNKARPTWEDMIIAYSTIPGFASIRDHEKGTWFIQSLVTVFMNHSDEYELIDLLRMTSDYLRKFSNERNEKQTCNVEMRHLYKRIYFNPGYGVGKGSGSGAATPVVTGASQIKLRRTLSTPPESPRTSHRHDQD